MFKVSTISEPIFFIYAINATKLKYRWYHLRGCWPLPQPSRFLISNAHSSLNITMFKDVTKQHNYVRTIFLYIPMYIYEYTYHWQTYLSHLNICYLKLLLCNITEKCIWQCAQQYNKWNDGNYIIHQLRRAKCTIQ